MTAKRAPGFRLEAALADPGFTPRARDLPELVALLDDDAHGAAAERALVAMGGPAALACIACWSSETSPSRARQVRVVGRIAAAAPEPLARELADRLVERLRDGDAKTRAVAARALGNVPRSEPLVEALIEALADETSPAARRSLVEALGKLGGARAAEALRATAPLETSATEQVRSRAARMAARPVVRERPSRFMASVEPPGPVTVVVRCRAGLEPLLAEELPRELADRKSHPACIEATLRGPPSRFLDARTMLSFGFLLPAEQAAADGAPLEEAIVRALTSTPAVELLTRFTEGPVRYRLAFATGGKRRAAIHHVAAAIAERRPELHDDPMQATWNAVIHEELEAGTARSVVVELVPRFDDRRFAYRQGDVPAASHPTLAAALVRLAGVRPDDVVWDPFVGSGTELCERHIAGPCRRLFGSDHHARALEIAGANLAAAGAEATLFVGDARDAVPPEPPTLVITNPPMGRRVLRGADLGAFFEVFLAHVASVVRPRARLAWISPLPARTTRAAERAGFVVERELDVDMGGFTGTMQRLVLGRPALAGATRGTSAPTRRGASSRDRR